jgi:hypothetical protein
MSSKAFADASGGVAKHFLCVVAVKTVYLTTSPTKMEKKNTISRKYGTQPQIHPNILVNNLIQTSNRTGFYHLVSVISF